MVQDLREKLKKAEQEKGELESALPDSKVNNGLSVCCSSEDFPVRAK